MKSFPIRSILPHVVAVIGMLVVISIYFKPVFEGKQLVQGDIVKNKAQSQEVREGRENGENYLWTTRVFSGMPVINIAPAFYTNVINYVRKIPNILPKGMNTAFICCIGMYILLLLLGVNPYLAMIGAIAYGLSSNILSSLMAGHNNKLASIAYLAPAVGGSILVFNGRYMVGGFIVSLFAGLMIAASHFQIIYYYLLISMIGGVIYFIYALKEKTLPDFFKTVAVLIAAGLLGFLPNFSKVYNVRDHSTETIRGGEKLLSSKAKKDEGGLDREYAMSWSHGLMETFSVVVPSTMGGSSQEELPKDGAVAALVGKQPKNRPLMGPTYIGSQPFLQGTIYFGAAFIFLFILSLFVVKSKYRVWFLAIIILGFFIGWGKNWSWFTYFLFDYFPLYNKFRTPSMALALAGFAIPAMGILGLSNILQNKVSKAELVKSLKFSAMITGGLMLLLLLYGLTSDWVGPKDAQLPKPWSNPQLYDALLSDRQSLFMSDWLISTLIMTLCGALVWLYSIVRLKAPVLLAVLGVVAISDNWRVSKRYLNDDSFKAQRQYAGQFNPSPVDKKLLADSDPHHRVIDLTVNPWTDGHTCYFHENIGGHHAAKLQRYQDMIENQFGSQLQLINQAILQSPQGLSMNPQVSSKMTAYNMLNTKYFIVQKTPQGVVQNPTACGNAWFVENIKEVSSHDDEMAEISNIDPLKTAIVHEQFKDDLYSYQFGKASNSSISLNSVTPDHLTYTSKNDEDGLAVFSEVIYTNGWHAYVDGEETPIYRVNYILRAMKIPAGNHTIEMKFEPSSYTIGENVSLAGSILFVLFGAGLIFMKVRNTTPGQEKEE